MKKRPLVVLSFFLILSAGVVAWIMSREGRSRPSVVLIVIDTLRADRLGRAGYFRNITPHLDALADDSLVFENAVAPAPWTTPSVAGLFTSLEPAVLGFETDLPIVLDDSVVALAEVFRRNGYRTMAVISHDFVGSSLNLDRGFDAFDQSNALGHGGISSPGVTETAMSLLEAAGCRPFFLFVHYFDPHFDYLLHSEFDFDPDYPGPLKSGEPIESLQARAPAMTDADLRFVNALYDSEIGFTDRHVGRLLNELKRRELYDRGLIVFAADHGEEFSERGDHWIGHTKTLYQELVHVPLFIKLPGSSRRGVVEDDVGLIDLMPTLVDHLGLKTPAGYRPQGRAIDLEGGARPGPRSVYSETRYRPPFQAVVQGGWKLIENRETGARELYDLESDPGEKVNLVSARPEEGERLAALLENWRQAVEIQRNRRNIRPAPPRFTEVEKVRLRSLGYLR